MNDKYNLIVQRLSDTARRLMELDPEAESYMEEYEMLAARYQDILFTGISDNLDNIVGVELFLEQESLTLSAEDMRVRMGQFSPQMQALAPMRQFAEYIEVVALSEVGRPFVDLQLTTTTGPATLEEVCRGRWVLLDFWATWCEPCLEQMPLLQQAYERYAIRGFEVCAVSLDSDEQRWRSYVEQNRLLWTNAIDRVDEEGSAVNVYGLHTIPANYLISPEGVIVARNLYGEALLHELEHIFEQ
jgi:thiol-disulfide isomerase/thioredoxin